MAAVQTQPSTVKPSFKSILSLPLRLCNPPPAVGKVRSFGVTPLFDVRLEDVLDRKHLPPLGLKDFEEWLLYVEMCPENLYFVLWLREYRARYAAWQKQRNSPNDAAFASTTAARLSNFYSRAKQTFLSPNSNYELNLTSSVLAPFQDPNQDSHPDPSFFQCVEGETHRMLEQSLRRFIHGQMNNVGNRRVLCGIIAGIVIIVIGFLPPIVTNFVGNQSRWLRLTALPGMWIGLTILLSALHGVCLGVYIFGDLRQLHKFELERPVPSKIYDSSPRIPHPVNFPIPPTTSYGRSYRQRQKRSGSLVSSGDFTAFTTSTHCREAQPYSMETGYIETNPIQGPSTCPIILEYCNPENDAEWLRQQELQRDHDRRLELEPHSPSSFTSTATFIAPFCSPSTTDIPGHWNNEEVNARWYRIRAMDDVEKLGCEAVRRQPLWDFDFDGLPPVAEKPTAAISVRSGSSVPTRAHSRNDHNPNNDIEAARYDWSDEKPKRWKWLLDLIDRIQTRCSFKKWGPTLGTDGSGPAFLGGIPPYLPSSTSSVTRSQSHHPSRSKCMLSMLSFATTDSDISDTSDTTHRVKKRNRLINAVPAFAVPLTRVLNPIIVRGQWEIVIRSAGLSFLISWIVCGSLLAVPHH